jgi:hypothetical protein
MPPDIKLMFHHCFFLNSRIEYVWIKITRYRSWSLWELTTIIHYLRSVMWLCGQVSSLCYSAVHCNEIPDPQFTKRKGLFCFTVLEVSVHDWPHGDKAVLGMYSEANSFTSQANEQRKWGGYRVPQSPSRTYPQWSKDFPLCSPLKVSIASW